MKPPQAGIQTFTQYHALAELHRKWRRRRCQEASGVPRRRGGLTSNTKHDSLPLPDGGTQGTADSKSTEFIGPLAKHWGPTETVSESRQPHPTPLH